ncbi:RNA polymerase II-associated protein 1-like [Haplochromis burtoni]|uniref:RNA polymerase II-associated protein 1-like n=1 Tax=Haplochromis burtoni TaxID=8153 RepID=UPI001C2DCA1A|nr:RNA polymerase II-associated protein 1-like [Haplochromis burtoni]
MKCTSQALIFNSLVLFQEVETARHSMLRKIYYLTDEVLRSHLLLFRLPQHHLQLGFDMYEQLPPIRAKRLERVLGLQESSVDKGD